MSRFAARLTTRSALVIVTSLCVFADTGCSSAETRVKPPREDAPYIPRFSRKGVPDSVILKPEVDGGYGSGGPLK